MLRRLAALAILLAAAPARAEPTKVTEVEGVSEYRLDNGARVLLLPDPSSPKVTVNMTVLVGSRHEGYGEAGMAHLLEHMLFKGTPAHQNIPKALQDRGASFNGTTWLDRTNYYETLPAEGDNLEFALRLEADRLVNSSIKAEDLASEFSVVRSEFERGENSPQRVLMQRMQAAAYEWHNYGRTTIGNRSDIERVPITKLREFYRKHYRVDNIVLIVAGKFESEPTLKLIAETFGKLQAPKTPMDKTYTIEPAQDGERTVVLRRVGDVHLAGACYHVPAASHEDFPAVDVLAHILGTEPSGRLYKQLVETKKASSVFTMTYDTHDPGLLWAAAEAPASADIEDLRRSLLTAIEEVGQTGVTAEEVQRAQQEKAQNFEKLAAGASHMASALSEAAARGDWRLLYLHRDRIAEVTPADVQRAAAKYCVRNNRVVGLFIPTDEPQRATVPDAPDLAALLEGYQGREQVEAGEVFDPSLDNIQQRTLLSEMAPGIKVAMLPKKTRGARVHLSVTLRYGNGEALKGRHAAGDLLPELMTRGTRQLTFEQLKDKLNEYGADLNGGGQPGLATFRVSTKREHLLPVIELLGQVLREPRLPEEEFDVLRRQQITSLEGAKAEPGALASSQLRRSLSKYPQGHFHYEPTIDEKIERWQKVTRQDVLQLYEKMLSGQAGEVALVGDFDPEQVEGPLQKIFDGWQSKVEYARIPDLAFEDIPGSVSTIVTPDKANAFYLAATQFRMTDEHEDYPALVVGNFVFGGGSLSSRLGDRVRQQEGLSYGVGSLFRAHPIDANAQFAVQAITNPKNRGKLQLVIADELKKLVAKGVTEDELERAKQGYLRRRQLRRSQDTSLLSLLSQNLFTDRTPQFQMQYEQQIADLTVEHVNRALREHIDPKQLVIVLAGDFQEDQE